MRPSKRDELVAKALDAFQAQGFHALGVDALAAEVGMSKTSIYNHFRTKEELILAVLRLQDERFLARFAAHGAGEADPAARLLALFDALAEWFATPGFSGCAFIKAAAEYQAEADPIRIESRRHKAALYEAVLERTRALKVADPDGLARRLMLLIEGATVQAQMKTSDAPQADARAAAETLIEAALRPRA